jgi:hypothetical protein
MKAMPESRYIPAMTTRRPPCGFRMSVRELFEESLAAGKVHSNYSSKQLKQFSCAPRVSTSTFEVGNDPALTAETTLAPFDELAQML